MRMLLAAVLVSLAAAPAQAKTQKLQAGSWEYKFDDKKVPKDDLARWIEFSDEGNAIPGVISNDPLAQLWMRKDKEDWSKWDTWGPGILDQAKKQLEINKAAVEVLRASVVPPELVPVKTWVMSELDFFLAMQAAQNDFVASWDAKTLNRQVGAVDAAKTCADAITKAGAAGTKPAKLQAVAYDWHNCVNNADPAGEYPKAAWKKFLKKYKIKAKQHLEDNE